MKFSFFFISILFATSELSQEKISNLQTEYNSKIKNIFDQKCTICHGDTNLSFSLSSEKETAYFQKLSKKAKKHFSANNGFPFQSKHSMKELISDINRKIKNNSMPPIKMIEINSEFSLTKEEREILLMWTKE